MTVEKYLTDLEDSQEKPESFFLAKNDQEIKTFCVLCGAKYKIRPFICGCDSNVFLRDID